MKGIDIMDKDRFDYDSFISNINAKADSQSFDQNIDMAIAICMLDFNNYQAYCHENNVKIEKFDVCIDAFTSLLLNRFNLEDLDCDVQIAKCNSFLEELQEEEADFFDECVNITCEIMHTYAYISTRDNRNIAAILKLCFESADFFLQRNDDDKYEQKIASVASCIEHLNVSSLTEIHESIRDSN